MSAASAATLTWTGGVAGVWQNGAAGWLSGGSPVNWNNATPDDAIFGGAAPGTVSLHAGGITVGNLSFTSGVYTLGGSGTLTPGGSAWFVGPNLTGTVTAALGGSAGLLKTGGGTLLLSGANKNYTGLNVVSGGVVRIATNGAGALGSTGTNGVRLAGGALHALFVGNTTVSNFIDVAAAGGELRNLGNDTQRWQLVANRITGTGTLTLSFGTNNTRFVLANAQSGFSGQWVIDSGGNNSRLVDLNFSSGNGFGGATGDAAVVLQNEGSLLIRNGLTVGSSTQGLTLGAGRAKIEIAGGATGVLAGRISGPAANSVQFYLNNALSVLVLSNTNNSWAGGTQLNGGAAYGTLRLGASDVFPGTGGVVDVTATARLDLNGFRATLGGLSGTGRLDNTAAGSTSVLAIGGNSSNTTFAGSITNSGAGAVLSLVKIGTGTLVLASSNLGYAGSTTVSGGVLRLGADHVLPDAGGGVTVAAGATLDLNGYSDRVGGLAGEGTVDNPGSNAAVVLTVGGNHSNTTFSGTITNSGTNASLTLVKVGAGTLAFSGSNLAYAGSTILSGGVIRVTDAGAGHLGASATGLVRLAGGALHGDFSTNVWVYYAMEIGTEGGELRNLGGDTGRWMVGSSNGLTGSGTLMLSFGNQNTRFVLTNAQSGFTGKWVVNSGSNANRVVDFYTGAAFGGATGDDAITLINSGSLLIRPGVILGSATQGITLGSGESKIEMAGFGTGTIAGRISGPATNDLQFYLRNGASLLILSNTANSWLGATLVANAGTLRLGAAGVIPDAGGTVTLQEGTVLDLGGFSETIGGLAGSGAVDTRATGAGVILTVGRNGATTTFSGAMSNSAAGSTLAFTKVGAGTLTLGGTSTYSGITLVSNGALRVNGALLTTGSVEVATGATLGGRGTVGRVRVRGGTLSPGTSPGTLSVASLTWTGGAYQVEVTNASGTAGVNWDLIRVAGGGGDVTNLAPAASPVVLDLTCSSASLPNFFGTNTMSWMVVEAANLVGYDATRYSIATTNFLPPQQYDGSFAVSSNAGDLLIVFTPSTNRADLAVSLNGPATLVNYGVTVTYTVVVSNASAVTAGSYFLTNAMGTNFIYVSSSGGGVYSNGVLSWSLAGLGAGAATTLTVTVTAPAATGTLGSAISVTTSLPDPGAGNNSQSLLYVAATNAVDLSVSVASSHNQVYFGSPVVYTLIVSNGSAFTSGAYYVTNSLGSNVTCAGSTGGGYYLPGGVFVPGGVCSSGVVTWLLGGLDPGATTTLTVTVTVPGTTGTIVNVVNVNTLATDPAGGNNSASVSVATLGYSIPTLSEWGMILLAAVLLALAAGRLRHRAASR